MIACECTAWSETLTFFFLPVVELALLRHDFNLVLELATDFDLAGLFFVVDFLDLELPEVPLDCREDTCDRGFTGLLHSDDWMYSLWPDLVSGNIGLWLTSPSS